MGRDWQLYARTGHVRGGPELNPVWNAVFVFEEVPDSCSELKVAPLYYILYYNIVVVVVTIG